MRLSLCLPFIIVCLTCICIGAMEQTISGPITANNNESSLLDSILSFGDRLISPLVDPASQIVAKAIEKASEAKLNDYHNKRIQEHIEKEVGDFNKFGYDLITNMKALSKENGLQLTHEQWLKYAEQIKKQHVTQKQFGLAEIKEFLVKWEERLISSAKNKQFDELDKKEAKTYLESIKQLQKADLEALEASWHNKQARYLELQRKLNLGGGWFKTALRYVGYGAVFLGGPYVGNILYKRYLEHFFSTPAYDDKTALMQHIKKIHKQCEQCHLELSAAQKEEAVPSISNERKKQLQELIRQLSDETLRMQTQINDLTEKMGNPTQSGVWRKYLGIATRVASMAAVTYIFYAVFRKIDERYLTIAPTDLPLTPEERMLLMQELTPLQAEKNVFEQQEFLAKQLDAGIISIQNAGDDASLIHRILGLKRALEILPVYKKSLEDMGIQADEIALDSLLRMAALGNIAG